MPRTMLRNKIGVLGLSLAVVATAAACGGGSDEAAAAGGESLTIGVGLDPTMLLPEVAAAQGFFADHGLDVDVVRAENGGAALQLVMAGDADAALTTEFPGSRALASGADLSILAQLNDSPDFTGLVTRQPISAAADLRGMKVGVTLNSAGYYFLARYLEQEGMSIDDVEVVDIAPPEMIPSFEQGFVDALAVWEPWLSKAEQAVEGSQIFSGATETAVYTTPEFLYADAALTGDQETSQAVLESLIDAETWVNENPEDAAALAAEIYNIEDDLAQQLIGIIDYRVQLTQGIQDDYTEVTTWMAENGLLESPIDTGDLFRTAALEAVDAARTQ